ncbi:SDR family NAD(P)-dependent oxidoreductase [Clostridium thermarum]|uniref:SDR family NAD(P)-dependent oxidoreductase n=1 Tax=Clostridium thermarum TaxID=1716543 RepID=UPI0013D32DA8|nr:SDR family NAD(P)-dependent oxidoreductase [Clostridium thermarum]
MKKVTVVTGADRGVGLALCEKLLEEGWQVFAGQFMPEWTELNDLSQKYPNMLIMVPLDIASLESVEKAAKIVAENTDHVDMLINNAGIYGIEGDIREGLDFSLSQKIYDVNALGPVRMVQRFLPLMENGMRRLCFVSSEAGSISNCQRDKVFGYCMSKAALNMAVKTMFNDLRPKGYTFRLYHPGWVRSYMSGTKATEGDIEPEESAAAAVPFFTGSDYCEDRLVMLDNKGIEWAF